MACTQIMHPCARRFAGNPEVMAISASGIGCLAVAGGLFGSFQWDTPAGPSIVVAACLLFLFALLLPQHLLQKND